jgi:hypothetical protein
MSTNSRLTLGIILLAISFLLPFGVYPVALTDWSTTVKAAVSGILFFSFEIMALPAVAIMGKENFERIVAQGKSWLKILQPPSQVGPVRYFVGLVFFLLPLIPNYVMAYLPQWLPDNSPQRLWVNLGSDAMFLVSLFLLGGDFWDKLRALFVRNAKTVFPE